MQIEIITFGNITDVIANGSLSLPDQTDTDQLKAYLERIYPRLAGIKYKLALNKALVHQNMAVPEGSAVAIMSPFSGG